MVLNKNLLYSTWNSAQCYVPAWTGEGFRGEWICINVWLTPFTVSPETTTMLLIDYRCIVLSHFSHIRLFATP